VVTSSLTVLSHSSFASIQDVDQTVSELHFSAQQLHTKPSTNSLNVPSLSVPVLGANNNRLGPDSQSKLQKTDWRIRRFVEKENDNVCGILHIQLP
jgi:hypothetical protein